MNYFKYGAINIALIQKYNTKLVRQKNSNVKFFFCYLNEYNVQSETLL